VLMNLFKRVKVYKLIKITLYFIYLYIYMHDRPLSSLSLSLSFPFSHPKRNEDAPLLSLLICNKIYELLMWEKGSFESFRCKKSPFPSKDKCHK